MTRKRRLTAGEDPASTTAPLSTEGERYQLYLRLRNYAAVAREVGVSASSIKELAQRHDWAARAQAHDHRLGMTKKAASSAKTIATIDALSDAVVDEEVQRLRDGELDEDVDPLHRTAGVVAVVERMHKVRSDAFAQLPEEPQAPLDLTGLTDAQLVICRAAEDLHDEVKRAKPGSPVAPASASALEALIATDFGREFLSAYGREHGLAGTLGLV